MPRDAAIRRLLGSPDWSIRVVEANGDCFYAAVAHARGDGETTARSLRDAVADALDEDARDALLAARLAGLDEFAYHARAKSFRRGDFRARTIEKRVVSPSSARSSRRARPAAGTSTTARTSTR